MSTEDTQGTPCPPGLGPLQPDVGNPRPAAPAFALRRPLRGVEDPITDERRRETRPTAVFASLAGPDSRYDAAAEAPTISVLSGPDRIGRAVHRTVPATSGQVLTVQPQTDSPAGIRAGALLDRGGRIRTLDGVTRRLIVVDREVASSPADRLGMNIRTARVRTAELAAALGGESRARLGHPVAESGIPEQEGVTE
ncbi:hypothetical protein [Streptomyces sp. NRRL B-24085]|uniref:hypothetical protein n=1 Tax=Streptomyces sp. NRRL B-24085 TaxID=1709476 RepID=UPI0006B3C196|nr:hypothetical protein [Streptomyces sp. NRRL B-24085]